MPTTDRPEYVVAAADDAEETVYLTRGRNGTNGKYHRTEACYYIRQSGDCVEWPLERARAWREPCSRCWDDNAIV